jgi:hypothetical protein
MNNLDIVLAVFTTPNHRFSRLDTTAALAELFPTIKPMPSTSIRLY